MTDLAPEMSPIQNADALCLRLLVRRSVFAVLIGQQTDLFRDFFGHH
jgi:hypothetical protein